jgi:hypothetical protein
MFPWAVFFEIELMAIDASDEAVAVFTAGVQKSAYITSWSLQRTAF